MLRKFFLVLCIFSLATLPLFPEEKTAAEGAETQPATKSAPADKPEESNGVVTPKPQPEANAAAVEKNEKSEKSKKPTRKRHTIKMAEGEEEAPPPEKNPADYQLSNRKLLEAYTSVDLRPYDRGEHMFISGLFGAIGGAFVGGLVGFSQYDKDDTTKSTNMLYAFGGGGAAFGALTGITISFFERGKIAQFALGKFLLKYSWYGTLGGAILGAGVGFIPYASSQNYNDIFHYAGYGAGVGFIGSLVLFFVDLPEYLQLYTYRYEDQNRMALTLRF